ncbi:branched-chain amino acid aminotransferase [Ruminococcaceae bacterium OttesenSCG-928-A16]|nr:branched-chain amino acid aminotransferase [Ruminococcaceae bacterium OttesenSCG-928-A16]
MQIAITQTTTPKPKPDETNLGFGVHYTDHMFLLHYTKEKGWHNAEIVPYGPFMMDPASMVFHYGQECFEGMKAYPTPSGGVQLFRPEKNAQRMASTHQRLCIPEIPEEVFVEGVKQLVKLDKSWVPTQPGTSLYIRPCTIATEPHLGVKASDEYLFFVICSPSGAYYQEGLNPVKIYVEEEYTRAAPGGTGFIKCGGNYGASLAGQEKAHKLGYSQVLWLDGVHRRYVEEVGSMNCFFKLGDTIYTAPTSGTVLPGITRMSCIDLLTSWGYTVKEEALAIDDLMAAAREGGLTEVFGTGTAAVVSPVGQLCYKEEIAHIGGGKIGEVTQRLYDTLTGIQWGLLPDTNGWMVPVE